MINETGTDEIEDDYTSYPEYKAAVVIWKVVPPMLIAFGTVGNILSIIVLTRKPIRASTISLYLVVLACSDLLVLYTGLLRQWIKFKFDTDVRQFSDVGCKVHIWLVYTSLDFSAWILMAVTLERVISAWWPHKARANCTRTPAIVFISAVGVFLLALNSHMLYGMAVHTRYDNGDGKCREVDESYTHFFNHVWPWIDLCAFCVLPLTVIVVGNACIIFKVLKSQRKTQSAVVPSVRKGTGSVRYRHGNGGKNSSMTAMLFTLNTVFLLTTTPVSIYNIGYAHWLDGATDQVVADLDLWWAIVNMLMYTNNSLNFLLYCLSGTRFRREVWKLFFPQRAEEFNILPHTRSQFDNSSHKRSATPSCSPSPAISRSNKIDGDTIQLPTAMGLHQDSAVKQTETCLDNETKPGNDILNRPANHETYSGNLLHPKAANSIYHNGLQADTEQSHKRTVDTSSTNEHLLVTEQSVNTKQVTHINDLNADITQAHPLEHEISIVKNSEIVIDNTLSTMGRTCTSDTCMPISDTTSNGVIGNGVCTNHTLEIEPREIIDDITTEIPIISDETALNDSGTCRSTTLVSNANMDTDHNAPILGNEHLTVNTTNPKELSANGVPLIRPHSVNSHDVILESVNSETDA